jgi:hypothetical protein
MVNYLPFMNITELNKPAIMAKQKRLAIITTHPIQYYAPLFKQLAQEVQLKVFYSWGAHSVAKNDPGFGKTIEWDIPLLDGYQYAFENNVAKDPGSHHFRGIINPDFWMGLSKSSTCNGTLLRPGPRLVSWR